MSSAEPLAFKLPFTHYAELGYHPVPCDGKVPIGGKGWNTRTYDYALLNNDTKLNVGLLCDNIVGLDIDIEDKRLADKIEKVCRDVLKLPKHSPRRIGKAPKRLLIVRVNEPMHGWDVMQKLEGGRGRTLFQLLGVGKQFIIHGTHPDTGKPYTLDQPLPAWKDLPEVTGEQLTELRLMVGLALIDAGLSITGNEGRQRNETGSFSHRRWTSDAEIDRVLEALKSISPELPRGEWRRVACALHDGTHGDEDGFDLFHAWSSGELRGVPVQPPKYKGEKDCWRLWRGLKPGKGITTGTLFDIARRGEWAEGKIGATSTPTAAPASSDILNYGRDLLDIVNDESLVPTPPYIEGLLYPKGLTMFYGKQKEGKSFALMQIAAACASGRPLWEQHEQSPSRKYVHPGFAVRGSYNVLMLCGEDHGARIKGRFAEAVRNGTIPRPVSQFRLLIREDIEALRASCLDENGMIPKGEGLALMEEMIREWARVGFKVIIIDTLQVIEALFDVKHPGDDKDAKLYAKSSFYDKLADSLDIAIIGTGHNRKGQGAKDLDMDPMDLINTMGSANSGISHFWSFTKLPEQSKAVDEDEGCKERRFYAMGREIEREVNLHIVQGLEGMGGLWANFGSVSDVELSTRTQEVMTALEAALEESDGKPVSTEALAKMLGSKANTVKVFMMRIHKAGTVWKGRQLSSVRGPGGGWKLA